MSQINKGILVQGVLTGILLFLFANPYYMWEYVSLGYFLRIIYGVVLLINFRKENNPFFILWIILLFYITIAVGNSVIASFVLIVSNLYLLSAKTEFVGVAYKTFYNVFVIFVILSIVNYVLFFLGVNMDSHVIDPINEVKNYNYTAYPFLVIPNVIGDFYRFEGVFDEPGAMASYCFLFLWAEKFDFFRWKNLILMLAGFLSLSLFFFLAIGVVMVIKFFSKGTNGWFRLLFIGVFLLFSFSLTIDDSITSIAIGDRLELDDEKGFKGNNRSNSTLDTYYDQVSWKEPLFYLGPTLVGINKEKVDSMIEGAAGYKQAILANGLLGCVFFVLFFIIYANKMMKKRRDFLLFSLCFLMTLYQRPFFTDIVYLFLFVSIVKLHCFQLNYAIKRSASKVALTIQDA